jgi:putative membrane protein insertion efficiency factor
MMRAPALGLIAGYRIVLAPLLMALFGPACRFEPSCSRYASAAISEYGALRGGLMAIRRLLRCHPLGGHGYDPVPATSARRAAID